MTADGASPDYGPVLDMLESEAIEILREGVATAVKMQAALVPAIRCRTLLTQVDGPRSQPSLRFS